MGASREGSAATGRNGFAGRDRELAALTDFLESPDTRCVLLTGDAGIGKSALLAEVQGVAADRGHVVVSITGFEADAALDYAGLADLLDTLPGTDDGLPAPQRAALDAVRLQADGPLDDRAVRTALLARLRELADDAPVLITLDDEPWLDAPTTRAVDFARRRLLDARVRFIVTAREPGGLRIGEAVSRNGVEHLRLGPLDAGAVRDILRSHGQPALSRRAVADVVSASAGNPLFALELARYAGRGEGGAGDDIPVPAGIAELLEARLSQLDEEAQEAVLALTLCPSLRLPELLRAASTDGVDRAIAAGVIESQGESVVLSHPLTGSTLRDRTHMTTLRALHRRLAGVVADPTRALVHEAQGAASADGVLAGRLAAAADAASVRRARAHAVELAGHALRLTPPESPERMERTLALAAHLIASGELGRATRLLDEVRQHGQTPRLRARALLLLVDADVRPTADIDGYLDDAVAIAGDDQLLRTEVLVERAMHEVIGKVDSIEDARAWAEESLALATEGKDAALQRRAIESLAWARSLAGRRIADLVGAERELDGLAHTLYDSVDRIAAIQRMWRGELDGARDEITAMLAEAEESGEAESFFAIRLQLCEIETRAGHWNALADLVRDWAENSEESPGSSAALLRTRAMLAVGRGDPARAHTYATRAAELTEDNPTAMWHRLEAVRARGLASLLEADFEEALTHLTAVWEHLRKAGVGEPGAFPVIPDLIQAMVACGQLDEAETITREFSGRAEADGHPWARAAGEEASAHVLAGRRDDAAAAEAFQRATTTYARLGFEHRRARCLLQAGAALHRGRRRREARTLIEAAKQLFDANGSPGWAALAERELGSISGRRSSGESLTPAEQRVADLVVDGLRNREVAEHLVVTERTVEATLTRIYTKLGIRSRTELVARLRAAADAVDPDSSRSEQLRPG